MSHHPPSFGHNGDASAVAISQAVRELVIMRLQVSPASSRQLIDLAWGVDIGRSAMTPGRYYAMLHLLRRIAVYDRDIPAWVLTEPHSDIRSGVTPDP